MREMSARDALKVGENVAAHVVVTIVGLVMAAVGIGLCVTIAMIWLGLPIGLIGAGLLSWGLWGFGEARRQKDQD
jgi:high-affinity Fe2+/Pb2+ permease